MGTDVIVLTQEENTDGIVLILAVVESMVEDVAVGTDQSIYLFKNLRIKLLVKNNKISLFSSVKDQEKYLMKEMGFLRTC